jgi:glycosyltransferase involved in cell wall biosynthesis
MQTNKDRVLWLASWFPSQEEPLTGDFIKRHAEALSTRMPVHVIHVKRRNRSKGRLEILHTQDEQFPWLTYSIAYYSFQFLAGMAGPLSYLYSLWLYYRLSLEFIKRHGKPRLIHCHIILRSGWVAWLLNWTKNIPYFLTEQYSGYMTEAVEHQPGFNFFNTRALRLITQRAACFFPVSNALGEQFKKYCRVKHFEAVYNVVNDAVFNVDRIPPVSQTRKPVFLHISSLESGHKDPENMLRGFQILQTDYKYAFELRIVGPDKPSLRKLATELGLAEHVVWLPECSQQALAELMREADAFVLYSRFETFGCVNIEALASGLPLVVSDIPTFKEYLSANKYVFFARPAQPAALAEALWLLIKKMPFDRREIAASVEPFLYENIADRLIKLYDKYLSAGI